jgi:hypothetical protein
MGGASGICFGSFEGRALWIIPKAIKFIQITEVLLKNLLMTNEHPLEAPQPDSGRIQESNEAPMKFKALPGGGPLTTIDYRL